MFADLHIHTTYSDGLSTPEEVVRMAAHTKLRALAITDHDTMEGTQSARLEAALHGIDIVDGVELSTECDGLEVHILAYCIDPNNTYFQEHLNVFRNARLKRAQKIVAKLQHMGIDITFDQVLELAGSGSVGRPHIAQALMAGGKTSSITEAFEQYIGVGKPAYEPRLKYHPVEMVKLVRKLGGVPVLAHPGISCGEDLINSLIDAGLQGLEVYHPKHSRHVEDYYLGLCRTYGLVATGGSDFHGVGVTGHGRLGEARVPYAAVKQLWALATKNSKL
ncbi:PHP domain-containing protein [Desulfoscipio gibsoniae]|uniref:Putative metal-dependent phosphoesterase, PHP family n=1 Tax=Desulfoscipio gibsoniae DSM 7213 TaxID=767817 RepID=R4KNX9_9FIRM|nr:PHP domain-containing protein [Desulfoscipio gibsoniae]AGL01336.1 putative metal-dependent phosphoesterase, PHP family [Desulfoscipio gibsoniae DSM 7213]